MKHAPLEPLAIGNLLALAQACAEARQCLLSTISRLAHGDPAVLDNIRQGKASITLRKYDATMAWLRDANNWPEGAAIPKVWEPWRRGPRTPTAPKSRGKGRARAA